MDAIVLGGGLMGAASTFFLARRGVRVTLIERNRVGTGATVASFGNIRRSGRYLPQLPLAARSLQLWGQAAKLLGRDVEFRATGHLRFAFTQKAVDEMRAFAKAARPWGLDLEELEPRDFRRRFPGLGTDAVAASFSPRDGSANPRLIAPAFADAACRLGAKIVEEVGVGAINRTGSGFEVVTSKGRYSAQVLLNAAGAWGARIAEQFGESVPIVARGPQMGVTEPLPYRVVPVVGVWAHDHGGGYLRQVERGNIVFGGGAGRTEACIETGYARADPARLPGQLRSLLPILPALENVCVIRTWSGCEGYIGDGLPVMGRSATTPGLFHAFGFCGHGFQLGPGVGDVMAEMIDTGRTDLSLDEFRVGRFAGRRDGACDGAQGMER